MNGAWVIWGSELSPFTLKVIRLFRHAQIPFRFLPAEGSWSENVKHAMHVERLKRGRLPLTWPQMTEDDEFPLVPFAFGPSGENLYDSSAIAYWLDRGLPESRRTIPVGGAAAFAARLVDDYADEFGLYMVHHNRWVVSAADNDAGRRVAREYRFLAGPFQGAWAKWFSRRQTRRLPYLFSTPATRTLLEEAFDRLLVILEALLTRRSFILGERFTIADAAIYGQLGMNLADPSADRWIAKRAPHLHLWLRQLHGSSLDTRPEDAARDDRIELGPDLKPLLMEIFRTHVPLMEQNAEACERYRKAGARRFNEAAFDRGEALYDGELDGQPFRHVAKTFQARVWRDCLEHWSRLSASERATVAALLPTDHALPA